MRREVRKIRLVLLVQGLVMLIRCDGCSPLLQGAETRRSCSSSASARTQACSSAMSLVAVLPRQNVAHDHDAHPDARDHGAHECDALYARHARPRCQSPSDAH